MDMEVVTLGDRQPLNLALEPPPGSQAVLRWEGAGRGERREGVTNRGLHSDKSGKQWRN